MRYDGIIVDLFTCFRSTSFGIYKKFEKSIWMESERLQIGHVQPFVR